MLVVIGTDCIGSCKSNYHTTMTMMAPKEIVLKVALNTITLVLKVVSKGDNALKLFFNLLEF
jgi:hypothetical protein